MENFRRLAQRLELMGSYESGRHPDCNNSMQAAADAYMFAATLLLSEIERYERNLKHVETQNKSCTDSEAG